MGGELIVVGVLGAFALGKLVKWRRFRRCKRCGGTLRFLGEEALTAGQRVEQRLGSVRYTARECRRCEVIFRSWDKSALHRYGECAGCGYHTQVHQTFLLRDPLPDEPGQQRVVTSCAHCDHAEARDESVPWRALGGASSSASSSDDSSPRFSGGSSDASSAFGSSGPDPSSGVGSSGPDGGSSGGHSSGGGAGASW